MARLQTFLEESEENARHLDISVKLLNMAPFGLAIVDKDGVIRGANNFLRKKLGYDWKGDLVGAGTHVSTILPDIGWIASLEQWFVSPLTSPLSHGQSVEMLRRDGTRTDAALTVKPLECGACGDMICLTEDSPGLRYAALFVIFLDDFPGVTECPTNSTCVLGAK